MDKVKPFVQCLHPIRIFNKYTGEPIITSCGKCPACMLHKSSTMSLRCQLESITKRFCMFVTLTYDNDHLPMAEPFYYVNELGRECVRVMADDVILSDTEIPHYKFKRLLAKFNLDGKIPYLYYRHIQLFMKRFRKHLDLCNQRYHKGYLSRLYREVISKRVQDEPKLLKSTLKKIKFHNEKQVEKIRYYAVGELGPVHFRPHWHLLIWFDDQETLAYFAESLRKSWTYGRIDYSMSRGDASSYCASYVNSSVSIPSIYKSKEIRPKQFHSSMLGCNVFKTERKALFEDDPRTIIARSIPLNGVDTEVSMWRSLKARFMPLCKGFAFKSRHERLYAYTLYAKVRNWTKEASPYRQAKQLTEFILSHGFTSEYTYEYFPPIIREELQNILNYFLNSTHIVELSLYGTPMVRYGDKYEVKEDIEQYLFNSIYNELYVSKLFYELCQSDKTSDQVLDAIERFYSVLDYENLKLMYQQQEQYADMELLSPHTMMFMYNNTNTDFTTFDGSTIKDILLEQPLYKTYHSVIIERFERSIKHKKLNDKNKIFL